MEIDMINPYVIRILVSLRKKDSIISISKRIGLSYGWTYKWVKELIKEGIVKKKWKGLILQEYNQSYKKILKFIRNVINPVNLYYSVLPLFGISYCFTKTDAVYLWTNGGYNVARYRDFYPIFIKIKKDHYDLFLWYCQKLNLKINSKEGVFYVPEILEEFDVTKKDLHLVEPLDETIDFMKKNIYNFQPALEMVKEMYRKKLDVNYKEVNNL